MKKNSVITHYHASYDHLPAASAIQTRTLAVWTNTRVTARKYACNRCNPLQFKPQMRNRTAIHANGRLLSAMFWSKYEIASFCSGISHFMQPAPNCESNESVWRMLPTGEYRIQWIFMFWNSLLCIPI